VTRRVAASIFFSGLLLAGAARAAVESPPVVIGGDGTSYRLWQGTFAEIFGDNPALPGATPILALDVVPPGQSFLRYLVPGTDGSEVESSPVLLYDSSSNAVHLVWNTRTFGNQTYARLALRSYSSGGWSEATEISGGTLTDKTHLRAALVNDDYVTRIDEAEVRVPRRTLHLVWSEISESSAKSYYSPVVFVGGRYLGWNPVVALDELAAGEAVAASAAPADLRAMPELAVSATGRATATFVHSLTQRLVTVEVRNLPGELGELAEMARGHIVALLGDPGAPDRAQLAEMARGHIVALATRFHASAASYVADRTSQALLEAPGETDGTLLAEMARGHIVALGREILDSGLANACAAEGVVLEIPPLAPIPGANFDHLFALRRIASWELPEGTVAGQRLLTSTDGSRALLAWENPGQLLYRETVDGGGWSDVRVLDLTQMSASEAWSAIVRRASGI
jgi:hypothetical protein